MTDLIKIAVDAMGGDNSPNKIIEGIIHHHKLNKRVFYKIFGDQNQIKNYVVDTHSLYLILDIKKAPRLRL